MSDIKAAAKINLFLLVGRKQRDGYHPVCSLMEKVSLYDSLNVVSRERGLGLKGMSIPTGENIITRGVAALEHAAGMSLAAEIEIDKKIPLAAGLAGGSSDAASVMVELVRLYGIEIPAEDLARAAHEVGADVPFFLSGGPQLAEGVGERLTPVYGLPAYHAVLAVPEIELKTIDVYQQYDELAGSKSGFAGRTAGVKAALSAKPDLSMLASLMVNDLEEAAESMAPQVIELKQEFMDQGAVGALMSGSGPAVFGLFAGYTAAAAAASAIRKTCQRTWIVSPVR